MDLRGNIRWVSLTFDYTTDLVGEDSWEWTMAAGCQNMREWGIRFPERSGLNHNLADRFRENKKFKVVFE